MNRSSQDWSVFGMGMDPIPGDPDVVRAYAARYSDVADAIGRASDRLRSIADEQGAESEFITAFRSEATKVAGKIAKAKTRYAGVATSVAEYAVPLEDAQTRSEAALRQAIAATDAQQSTHILIEKYQNEIEYNASLTPDETKHYTLLLHHAQQAYQDAVADMYRARASLQAAMDSRDAAATRAANQIENVENTGGLNDSGWTQWWDANGTWVGNVVEGIGIAAAVIILFVPGLGEAEILIIMAIAGGLAIANAISQLTAGTESPGEAALDIVFALIPFGGGLAAKSALKIAGEALLKSGAVEDAGKAVSAAEKSPAVRKLEEDVAKEAEGGAKGIAKNVFSKLVKNDTETMEKLQTLANRGLAEGTEAGENAARVAEQQMWKIRAFLGPVPEFIGEKAVHKLLDDPLSKLLSGGRDQ